MKLKFFDSKDRIRTIFLDAQSLDAYYKGLIDHYSDYFGPLFKEKISEFVASLDEQRRNNYMLRLSRLTGIPKEEIDTDKIIASSSVMLSQYLTWLDDNYPDNPDRTYGFYLLWNDRMNKRYDSSGETAEKKYVTFKNKISELINAHNLINVDDYTGEEGIEHEVYLTGKLKDINALFEDLTNIWNTSIKAPEGSSKKGEITPAYIKSLKNQIKNLNLFIKTKDLKYLTEDICESDKDIEDLKIDIEELTADLEGATEEEKNETLSYIDEDINELIGCAKEDIADLEEEINLVQNPSSYTVEEVKRNCLKDLEKEEPSGYANSLAPGKEKIDTDDSKDWYNAENVKFLYNFENSQLIRDGKAYNYFDVAKKLQSKYLDSNTTISYEKWLSNNPQIITDTLNKIDEGEKKMNDSLKDLKFKFKNTGIEITVLDSEGKSFEEVKKEVIEVHRQMVSQQMKDSEKETKEVLEDLNAKATNDSVEDSEKETKEVLEDLNAKATNDSAEDVEMEDSVEETEEEKYKVVVNGKEIGIYNTLKEAEEAEKKALEAIEKGIPQVNIEDDIIQEYEDANEQKAYENAMECIKYGVGKSDCDFCGISNEKANEIWKHALKHVAEEL